MPESTSHLRWAVVGGGMLGMTLALRLAQQGCRVTLFEARERLGGLADAWQLGGLTWDRHYHVTLLSDRHLRALLDELGMSDQLRWNETKTGFFTDGQLYSMSNTWEFLRFPPLRLVDKLRLGMTIFYASKIRNWRRLESILVGEWLRKLSGRRTYEAIWLPLLRAKLGDNYKHTSAAFIWATISRMYAARRTGLKREMFGYVSGGYNRVLRRFADRLDDLHVDTRLNTPIHRVSCQQGSANVEWAEGSETFDRVVVTSPAPIVSQICPQLTAQEHERLRGIRYQGILCASLLLRRPLSPYYVTNITDEEIPFTGVIEMSALVDRREFQGRHLVYLPKYVPSDDPVLQNSEKELRELFVGGLKRMHPDLADDDILAFRHSKVRHVCALSTLHYSQHVPQFVTSVPNLFVVTSAQIVNGTLNVNETVNLANTAIDTLIDDLPIEIQSNHVDEQQVGREPLAGPR